jgi:hypothetical protein
VSSVTTIAYEARWLGRRQVTLNAAAALRMDASELLISMPDALGWQSSSHTLLNQVHENFVQLVQGRLSAVVRAASGSDDREMIAVVSDIRAASDGSLARVLLAPETTTRLLQARQSNLADTCQYLRRSLAVEEELWLKGAGAEAGRWTALGDALVCKGRVSGRELVPGLIPIDFHSPFGNAGGMAGSEGAEGPTEGFLSVNERAITLERLADARDLAAESSGEALDAVRALTKVLVLRIDPRRSFSSGSTGLYVGRTVLGNPHAPGVTAPEVAEALVHEAIHSALYMLEWEQPWVPVELYTNDQRVLSPWSGRLLPVRPFLQACFVWFGLANFWAAALKRGVVPLQAQVHLTAAIAGFLRRPLLDQMNGDDLKLVVPQVRDAVNEMQLKIRRAFDG